MTWRELKHQLEAMPAALLDQHVRYVEPYDDRQVIEPDLLAAVSDDICDSDGRLRIGKGEPFLA